MRLFLAIVFCTLVSCAVSSCPQGTCSSSQTCCDGPVPGEYGCCPQPNAVCCTDGLHCCPTNTVCNLAAGTCDDQRDNNLIPFQFRRQIDPPKPQVAIVMEEAKKVAVVYCPGGQSFCPDGNTCCLLNTGQYGCCPYPAAICCIDHVHCCPAGTRCDTTSTYCLQGEGPYSTLFRRKAHPVLL